MPQFVFHCLATACSALAATAFAQQTTCRPLDRRDGTRRHPACTDPHGPAIDLLPMRKSFRGRTPTTRCSVSAAGAPTCARARASQSSGSEGAARTAPGDKGLRQRAVAVIRAQRNVTARLTHRRNRDERALPQRSVAALIAAVLLGGCASTAVRENFGSAQQFTRERLGAECAGLTPTTRAATRKPTSMRCCKSRCRPTTRCASRSPTARRCRRCCTRAQRSAAATQSARLPNPVFTFERLVRNEGGMRELEIGRTLAISVLDLFLLPARLRMRRLPAAGRLKLTGDVVQAALDARQAWVRAVAAQQSLQYARAGQARRRCQRRAGAAHAAGRQLQQAAAGARAGLLRRRRAQPGARASRPHAAAREALVRALGLMTTQARALQLPERLPDLPADAEAGARRRRAGTAIDAAPRRAMARAEPELRGARARASPRDHGFVNVLELGTCATRERARPRSAATSSNRRCRCSTAATARAARGAGALHGSAATAPRSWRSTRAPRCARPTAPTAPPTTSRGTTATRSCRCARRIAEENLLRYNGMLIGVFELLADAREQIAQRAAAIEAQRDFWLADADLRRRADRQAAAPMAAAQRRRQPPPRRRRRAH